MRNVEQAAFRAWARLQVPDAHGRYLMSNPSTIPSKAVSEALRSAFPQYKFPPGKDEPSKKVIDISKVWTLVNACRPS